MQLPHTCPLARIRPLVGRYVPPEVVVVRVPLLHLSNFQINDFPDLSAKSFAIMELVDVVADQNLGHRICKHPFEFLVVHRTLDGRCWHL
ncbi:unnamed protein product [Lathyrus sativus]|nr:unnamed protein product [Lathyrus sativus]